MSRREILSLKDTVFLGCLLHEDVKYFFYEAKVANSASDKDIAECLRLRYQKYGDVVFQRKPENEDTFVIFTLLEQQHVQ